MKTIYISSVVFCVDSKEQTKDLLILTIAKEG